MSKKHYEKVFKEYKKEHIKILFNGVLLTIGQMPITLALWVLVGMPSGNFIFWISILNVGFITFGYQSPRIKALNQKYAPLMLEALRKEDKDE